MGGCLSVSAFVDRSYRPSPASHTCGSRYRPSLRGVPWHQVLYSRNPGKPCLPWSVGMPGGDVYITDTGHTMRAVLVRQPLKSTLCQSPPRVREMLVCTGRQILMSLEGSRAPSLVARGARHEREEPHVSLPRDGPQASSWPPLHIELEGFAQCLHPYIRQCHVSLAFADASSSACVPAG